jgi:transposase
MPRERRSFSQEYKLNAVRRIEKREHSVSHIARELGVSATLLQTWRRRFTAAEAESTVKPGVSLEEENRRLRRENAALREDREILKKASMFFAKELP